MPGHETGHDLFESVPGRTSALRRSGIDGREPWRVAAAVQHDMEALDIRICEFSILSSGNLIRLYAALLDAWVGDCSRVVQHMP